MMLECRGVGEALDWIGFSSWAVGAVIVVVATVRYPKVNGLIFLRRYAKGREHPDWKANLQLLLYGVGFAAVGTILRIIAWLG